MGTALKFCTIVLVCTFAAANIPGVVSADEIWVAPGDRLAKTKLGDWATTSAGKTIFSFAVPDDMTAFLGAKVVVIAERSLDITYNLYLSVSADGEPHNGPTYEELNLPISMVAEEMLEIDVSSIFPSGLVPGEDYISLAFRANNKAYRLRVVGLRFQYEGPAVTSSWTDGDGVVSTSGKVGIGTTIPGAELEVAGQIKITGGNPGVNKVLTSDANGLATWQPLTSCIGADEVESAGRCWKDRNLGASRVATSSTDSAAYGDLYQWGRHGDGHQNRTSAITAVNSANDVPGHSDFITESLGPYDWRDPQNHILWQGLGGVGNPCPQGFRLPTIQEWDHEMRSWGSNNATGAFASPLKLTLAGYRDKMDGSIDRAGITAYYWSSTVNGEWIYSLGISTSTAHLVSYDYSAYGNSVRCVKD